MLPRPLLQKRDTQNMLRAATAAEISCCKHSSSGNVRALTAYFQIILVPISHAFVFFIMY